MVDRMTGSDQDTQWPFEERALKAASDLDRSSQSLRIRAATGLPASYVTQASARLGDNSLTSRVIATGEVQVIPDVRSDDRFRYPDDARQAGWVSQIGSPIRVHGQTTGVIEFFTRESRELDPTDRDRLRRLADVAGAIIESASQSRESRKLTEFVWTSARHQT